MTHITSRTCCPLYKSCCWQNNWLYLHPAILLPHPCQAWILVQVPASVEDPFCSAEEVPRYVGGLGVRRNSLAHFEEETENQVPCRVGYLAWRDSKTNRYSKSLWTSSELIYVFKYQKIIGNPACTTEFLEKRKKFQEQYKIRNLRLWLKVQGSFWMTNGPLKNIHIAVTY